ncbi:helix-turn-helix domain-containing protein [Duganella callida]|uniref:AraC family transcriptional regulator n=1 Tax=Duganella callida TaxID=2561932 RepID=A0A4Y9SS21_9BURK|nr:AraC family transcriptional regulator [Duganella callida]TFW29275.1 AraC family transcriptional regulator [Duganella callida]
MTLSLDQALGQLDITATAFRRITLADDVLPHAACGQVHFVAVLAGSGVLQLTAGPLAVTAGQLLLLPGDAAPQPGRGIASGLTLAHGLLGASLLDGRSLFDFLALPHTLEADGTELFTGAIPELLRESAYGGPGSGAIITCLARRLVTALVRDAWPQTGAIPPAQVVTRRQRLRQIVDLMYKDPGRDYTLDGLADAAAMSRTVFHREFVACYGSSPLVMLRTLRLKRAEELLRQTDMPVKTITARLGYRSRSHFSKLFKDAYGIDPEQFRRQRSLPAE